MSTPTTTEKPDFLQRLSSKLRQWEGPLTRDLMLTPGKFGLGHMPDKLQPDAVTQMVCGYCSTGCGLNVHLRKGEAVNLSPAAEYPVNLGLACPKGWETLAVLESADRATTPLLRNSTGQLQPTTWDRAATEFRRRFQAIQQQHGPDSVAFLSTGQIPCEEMLFLGALAKFGMGFVHGDSNTRQCMATSAVAYKQSFGFDAPPYTYADFEESDVIVLIGSNLCVGHPIMWERVLRNRRNPRIVVIDPRRTETAQAATQHLAIQPKSDLTLLYGLANLLITNGWIDEHFIRNSTTGFDDFRRHVSEFTPDRVCAAAGISPEELLQLARTIHEHERVSFWWTMGVNQSYEGVRTAQAIINLALITGNIGRPGTGANSITGQCNAMGSRLFSNTSDLIGGRDFTRAADRQEVAEILGIDVARVPASPSLKYDQILDEVKHGRIKGLWVIATNPAHSWINQNEARAVLEKLDFLVVQDMYASTETAQLADLLLPAAGWGEKEGTLINSERRFGVLKKVARAPGEALADFSIFKLLAQYWGCGELFTQWKSPADAFESMKALSRGRPFDITGIADYEMIDSTGGIQWPYRGRESLPETDLRDGKPASAKDSRPLSPETERRLFADGRFFTPDGKARLVFDPPGEMPEPPCDRYPFLLLTGRGTVSQWHTQTRTSKSAVLRKLYPQQIYFEIHPQDAARLGIQLNAEARIESRRGAIMARAFVTATVQPGQIFIPMHYVATNQLTLPHFDPHSRQPSYKDCAVQVCAIEKKERRS